MPNNLGVILHAVGILLTYGRHLIDTISQRATAPNFFAIAAHFGTANVSTIIAHLNRGILRAMALERVLLARAATGKDIEFIQRDTFFDPLEEPAPEQQAPIAAEPEQPEQPAATELPPMRKRASRSPRPAGWDDPTLYLPTLEELEREARRRPVGLTILDICLDIAVVPGICQSAFWSELFDIIHCFGRSVNKIMAEETRRRKALADEQDHNPNANWDWLTMTRDGFRQVLGFLVGEPPVNPLEPAAATGPP